MPTSSCESSGTDGSAVLPSLEVVGIVVDLFCIFKEV